MSSGNSLHFDAPHLTRDEADRPLKLALGPWSLVRLAGGGPLTCVYQARPIRGFDDRPASYAIKLLRERYEEDQAAIDVMRSEANVGREVKHPHLVAILSAHVHQPPYYVVMPWLEGQTLANRIASNRCDLPTALWIIRQAAEALDALYQSGWMHCDVKPENLMVSSEGHTTLLDLGFGRRLDDTEAAPHRIIAGTMEYVAPEMIVSAVRADIRSDLYSLGVVLYELLAGQRPFFGNAGELAQQHCQCEPRDVRRLVPTIPKAVGDVVRCLLSKVPLRRPQTPQELIDRLTALEVEAFDERMHADKQFSLASL